MLPQALHGAQGPTRGGTFWINGVESDLTRVYWFLRWNRLIKRTFNAEEGMDEPEEPTEGKTEIPARAALDS